MSETLLDHFNSKWVLQPETGCWQWIAARAHDGYGKMRTAASRSEAAHRVSYKLFVGEIPAGLQIRHKCGNKLCVRPSHLLVGTHEDNESDKTAGAILAGEAHYNAKLTAVQVAEIRARYAAGNVSYQDLANDYNVSREHIGYIVNNKVW